MASLAKLPAVAPVRPAVVRRSPLEVSARAAATKSKAKAKAAAMVCVQCGYIYTGKEAFEDLPNSYRCPVCAAPKKAFKEFEGPVSRSNDTRAMQDRRDRLAEQLAERGESADGDGLVLQLGIAAAALLGGLYWFATNR